MEPLCLSPSELLLLLSMLLASLTGMEWGGSGRVGGYGSMGGVWTDDSTSCRGSGARAFVLKSHNIFQNTF